jgi:hypothetical protein
MGGILNYTFEMGLGAMIYISTLRKIGSGIEKLRGRGGTHTNDQEGDFISLLLF